MYIYIYIYIYTYIHIYIAYIYNRENERELPQTSPTPLPPHTPSAAYVNAPTRGLGIRAAFEQAMQVSGVSICTL